MNHGNPHLPHPRIEERQKAGPHLTGDEHIGFNGRLSLIITKAVSTMWCAYLFAGIALISLPAALAGGCLGDDGPAGLSWPVCRKFMGASSCSGQSDRRHPVVSHAT